QIDHAALGGDISALQAQRHQTRDRGDVDDASRFLRAHQGGDDPADLVQTSDVHGENAIPFRTRILVDRHPMGQRVDAGVVDENVDAAELGDNLVHGGLDVVGFRDVEPQADAAGYLRGGVADAVGVDIGEDDTAAVGGQA